jgi:hypothetical protein
MTALSLDFARGNCCSSGGISEGRGSAEHDAYAAAAGSIAAFAVRISMLMLTLTGILCSPTRAAL